jgi:hypothetical protein
LPSSGHAVGVDLVLAFRAQQRCLTNVPVAPLERRSSEFGSLKLTKFAL